VFAVCSVLREEGEAVVASILEARPELALAPFDSPVARALAEDAPTLRLLPHVHGTDGYFLASFARHRILSAPASSAPPRRAWCSWSSRSGAWRRPSAS
jgi:hypothetical protein